MNLCNILLVTFAITAVFAENYTQCTDEKQVCAKYYMCINGHISSDARGTMVSRFGPVLQSCDVDAFMECCLPPAGFVKRPRKKTTSETTTARSKPLLLPESITEEESYIFNTECGSTNQASLLSRITGDLDAETGELPWNIVLMEKKEVFGVSTIVYFCGGSLIHPKVVLTTAHCIILEFSKREVEDITVRGGEMDFVLNGNEHQDRSVDRIITHEDFIRANHFNNVALLILTEEFEITPNVGTICIPNQDQSFDGSRCWVSGFGANETFKPLQTRLKKIDVPVIGKEDCEDLLRETPLGEYFMLDDSFICAGGEEGKDSCNGDGGAALVCKVPGTEAKYCQAGMVSYGAGGCGHKDEPSVYVKVSGFRDWINDKFSELKLLQTYGFECNGPYKACGKKGACDENMVIVSEDLKKKARDEVFAFTLDCKPDEVCCRLAQVDM